MRIITHSAEQTEQLGRQIGARLKSGDVIAFSGGLGAGKTAMTRGIAAGMGLGDDVSSPTFSLMNEYSDGTLKLYHFDMYRIPPESSAEELDFTGFYECIESGGVTAVEWSENIAAALPQGTIRIDIKRISDNEREITVNGDDRF